MGVRVRLKLFAALCRYLLKDSQSGAHAVDVAAQSRHPADDAMGMGGGKNVMTLGEYRVDRSAHTTGRHRFTVTPDGQFLRGFFIP